MDATNNGGREQVVISMTSFPAAIVYAEQAVRSLLQGHTLPDKIVLYLTFEQFGGADGIPASLKQLAEDNPLFEIRDYPRDIRSYRKLVPALRDFPDAAIVTVDDDVHYHPDMLGRLLEEHERYPDCVVAHRAKCVDASKPYRKWHKYRWYDFLTRRYRPAFGNIQTGVGGVLYPPGCLRPDMIDEKLFWKIAPTSDDFWFWAAAVAAGTRILPVPFGQNKPRGLGKPRELSLKSVNFKSKADSNDKALESILKNYPIIRQRIESEK